MYGIKLKFFLRARDYHFTHESIKNLIFDFYAFISLIYETNEIIFLD